MSQATLSVRADEPIGTISPRLYGQFAEHLGRCCYDGLWVGDKQTDIPHTRGFRTDVVTALRSMPLPMLRWPGGCYADHYHWRDGIGPPADRPRRLGMSCGMTVEDDNSLGLHEFLDLCLQLGAEPYLAGNVGSGSPQELCDWLEYTNAALDTTLTRERRANGAVQPFGVRLWGVGNENWGCGGNFDAVDYAHEYRRYATLLRHVDATAELVACGHDDAWNASFLQTLGRHVRLVDHLSIHRYWNKSGSGTNFSDDDYYALLADAQATEAFVKRTSEIVQDALEPGRRMGIALDEWGVWHPEARLSPQGLVTPASPRPFEQANTLRDALAAAIALEGFHRQCQVLTLANIAQVVNVLQAVVMTDGDTSWRTPTYHAFRLHAAHIGAVALTVQVGLADSVPDGSSAVSATASRSERGIAVTLINRHRTHEAEVCLDGVGELSAHSGELLSAATPEATNSVDRPDLVVPTPVTATGDGRGAWRIDLPPHSMATILFG